MSPKLCIYLLIYHTVHSIDISCVTEESTPSPGGFDTETSIQCSNSAHTLVSCGFRTAYTAENDVGGSWISGQTCYADNVDSDGGAIAIARCCDLSVYSVSCNTKESAISDTANDAKIDVSCSSSETLMGCTARAMGMRMDGMYPGKDTDNPFSLVGTTVSNPHSCTGWNAEQGGGIRSYATCCSSSDPTVTFQCDAIYSQLTMATSFSFPCPNSNQFMTSCSAADGYRDMNRWEINETTHECNPRNSHVKFNENGFGTAICCTITTEAPTKTPTQSPTENPSKSPTNFPSKTPTESPTNNPSKSPTKNPTTQPSIFPTKYPTKQPMKSPTDKPTTSPTIEDRDAGVNEETTPTPQLTKTGKNSVGSIGEDKGLLGGGILIDYLLYVVIGLLIIIFLLCYCMVLQKKKNEKHLKESGVNGAEMTKVNSITAETQSIFNTNEIKSVECNGENEPNTLPVPPLRSPKGPNDNGVNGVIMNMELQQQQLINNYNSMAVQPIPSQPVVNQANLDPNNAEYIEGLGGSMASFDSVIPNGVTTKGDDVQQNLNSNEDENGHLNVNNEDESESDEVGDEIYNAGRNSTAQ